MSIPVWWIVVGLCILWFVPWILAFWALAVAHKARQLVDCKRDVRLVPGGAEYIEPIMKRLEGAEKKLSSAIYDVRNLEDKMTVLWESADRTVVWPKITWR